MEVANQYKTAEELMNSEFITNVRQEILSEFDSIVKRIGEKYGLPETKLHKKENIVLLFNIDDVRKHIS